MGKFGNTKQQINKILTQIFPRKMAIYFKCNILTTNQNPNRPSKWQYILNANYILFGKMREGSTELKNRTLTKYWGKWRIT